MSPVDVSDKPLICLDTEETTTALNRIIFEVGYKPSEIIYANEIEVVPMVLAQSGGFFAR